MAALYICIFSRSFETLTEFKGIGTEILVNQIHLICVGYFGKERNAIIC